MGAQREHPEWDPLHYDPDGYYYESMADIEDKNGFRRPEDQTIDRIEAYLHTDYSYLVKLDFVFKTGELYSFQSQKLDSSKVPAAPNETWDYSGTSEHIVAPYAYYDQSRDTLAYLGFVTYDQGIVSSDCRCENSDLSFISDATFFVNEIQITNGEISIPNFSSQTVLIDTSTLQNTVDLQTGVQNFCGEYKFALEERGTNRGDHWLEFLPHYVTVCLDDCQISDQQYTLATFTPDTDELFGKHEFTFYVTFQQFPAIATEAS